MQYRRGKRFQQDSEKAIEILQLTEQNRSKDDINFLIQFLMFSKFFRDLASSYSSQIIEVLAYKLNYRIYQPNQFIVYSGDKGEEFFLIIEGTVSVQKLLENEQEEHEMTEIRKMFRFEHFGEMALITNHNIRTASVKATELTKVAVLNKNDFFMATGNEVIGKLKMKIDFFSTQQMFMNWSRREIITLSYLFNRIEVQAKQLIYTQGNSCNHIYFIESGEFKMIRKIRQQNQNKQVQICLYSQNHIIGLEQFLNINQYITSVVCNSVKGVLYKINSNDSIHLLHEEYAKDYIEKLATEQIEFINSRIEQLQKFSPEKLFNKNYLFDSKETNNSILITEENYLDENNFIKKIDRKWSNGRNILQSQRLREKDLDEQPKEMLKSERNRIKKNIQVDQVIKSIVTERMKLSPSTHIDKGRVESKASQAVLRMYVLKHLKRQQLLNIAQKSQKLKTKTQIKSTIINYKTRQNTSIFQKQGDLIPKAVINSSKLQKLEEETYQINKVERSKSSPISYFLQKNSFSLPLNPQQQFILLKQT